MEENIEMKISEDIQRMSVSNSEITDQNTKVDICGIEKKFPDRNHGEILVLDDVISSLKQESF
jgi:hypothetical protein